MIPNDHWTLDLDQLGMASTGQRLARLILQCQPPYAICVQGKWGSGKTSLMRHAMAALGGVPLAMSLKTSNEPREELPIELRDDWARLNKGAKKLTRDVYLSQVGPTTSRVYEQHIQVVPIWFNPWQHQHAELPLVALLQELRAQFSHLVKFGRQSAKLSQVAVEAGLNLIGEMVDLYVSSVAGTKTGVGKSFDKIRAVGERYERHQFESVERAQRLNLMFEEAVNRLLRPGEASRAVTTGGVHELRRLVVFVDDLDRCNEEQTVRLLEAIKLYLQTPYCVFVIGMDGAAARRAVERVLPHTRPEEAQEYLEKLFQSRIYVPIPGGHERFVQTLQKNCRLTKDATGMTMVELAGLIVGLIEPNPRKLKSFVGTLAIGWQIGGGLTLGGTSRKAAFTRFLLITYVRANHPDVFRLLAHDPSLAIVLNAALTEDAEQPQAEASPVRRFFYRSFRHAFDRSDDADADAAVDALLRGLDRYRGDRTFLRLWREAFADQGQDIPALLAPALQVSCDA